MPPAPVSYRLDDAAAGRRLFEITTQRFPNHRLTGTTRSTTFYDTFDWRIFRQGGALKAEFDGHSKVLYWLRADNPEILRAPGIERPGFVWDLPAGPLRDSLESVIEMRRLLPLFTIEGQSETLHILDDRRKTVARVQWERLRAHQDRGQGETADLPTIMRALPVRGYDKHFRDLVEALGSEHLNLLEEDELSLATTAFGLRPGSYSRKLNLQLEPDQRSDEALKIVLRRLFEVMQQNEKGLRTNTDTEFLHDFRVSVRRTRSALSQLKGVFPPAAVAHFKSEFSWLGQITGPTRDLDVYLLKMPAYRASLPESMRADLDPLNEFLERHQHIEHRDLVQFLDTQRYRSLLNDWRSFLDQPFTDELDRPEAATPIFELASRRIWRSARKVLRKGQAIDPQTPAAALHRLRIHCKKLRYLLEFFSSLYAEREMLPLIDALKRLQDNLGDFNDLEVQQGTLRVFAQTMQVEKIGTVSSFMAMGRLVERLEYRQIEERQIFHKRFARFSNRKNRQRFKTLFKPSESSSA